LGRLRDQLRNRGLSSSEERGSEDSR
jgi:hypothetical protein